jgi:hypothetical protein
MMKFTIQEKVWPLWKHRVSMCLLEAGHEPIKWIRYDLGAGGVFWLPGYTDIEDEVLLKALKMCEQFHPLPGD